MDDLIGPPIWEAAPPAALAAALLAGVFALAAATKFRAPEPVARAADDLGLPSWILVAVPWLEASLAAVLVLATTLGGLGSTAVLSGFTVFIAGRYRQGGPLQCRCFGAASRSTVGPVTFARNGVLLMVSLVLAFA